METISVFDIFKVGVGPSSSHTMGPWVAAGQFIDDLKSKHVFDSVEGITVRLFGSLSKTGKGHGTDIAVILGLMGYDPKTINTNKINALVAENKVFKQLELNGERTIEFDPVNKIKFEAHKLPFHPNALSFYATSGEKLLLEKTYYSVGGGFVVGENDDLTESKIKKIPYPTDSEADLKKWIKQTSRPISSIVLENELFDQTEEEVDSKLNDIWQTMKFCVYKGCHISGTLPGGLNVSRRAENINTRLMKDKSYSNVNEWIKIIKSQATEFDLVTTWVSVFALSVNEENASFGRVVTAPTNGAAGVIPAVLMYYLCFCKNSSEENINKFLLTAGEIGSIFKKGSTISAAMGGCQAEIGVSSSMAAAGLTELLGGTPQQVLMAAEIAMEHHLGLTCDPIGGLVQIPCIERNTMGAMKAITACKIALNSDPREAKVSLDNVIKTMWETARDMHDNYKETSDGGLAINVSVLVPEC